MKVSWSLNARTGEAGILIDGSDADHDEYMKRGTKIRRIILDAITDAMNASEFGADPENSAHVGLATLQYAALMFLDAGAPREVFLDFCRQSATHADLKDISENVPDSVLKVNADTLVH